MKSRRHFLGQSAAFGAAGVLPGASNLFAQQPSGPGSSPDDISQIAPEFNRLTTELINGDLWKRTDLSPRDRSLVTITILATLNKTEQIDFHLNKAFDNGLKQEEIVAAMTHTAFYAGWPSGYTGITHLKGVVEQRKAKR